MIRDNRVSRRTAIRSASVGAAALALGVTPAFASSRPRLVPGNPTEALERLMAGNQRFVRGETEAPRRSIDRVRELSSGQAPYAALLGCADSRVPIEILFDEGFGDLFSVRVAGNVATPEEIASLEYAVGVLGSKLVVVLGHTSCGAVTAAVQGDAVPGQISALFQHIAPNLSEGASVEQAIEENVRHQVRVLSSASPVIRDAVRSGDVAVKGAIYSLSDGEVRLLD
jgi:carbonic anhydrase